MTEVEEKIFSGHCWVVVCTSRVVKMKGHLPFLKEFSILYSEDRIVAYRVV